MIRKKLVTHKASASATNTADQIPSMPKNRQKQNADDFKYKRAQKGYSSRDHAVVQRCEEGRSEYVKAVKQIYKGIDAESVYSHG